LARAISAAAQRLVGFSGNSHGIDMLAGHDEHVDRGLRVNVGKGVALLVLVDGRGGNASVDDLAKQAIHGESSVPLQLV